MGVNLSRTPSKILYADIEIENSEAENEKGSSLRLYTKSQDKI